MTKTYIAKVTEFQIAHYSDNDQTRLRCGWVDNAGFPGATEGVAPIGGHMLALFNRAIREHADIHYESF